MGINCGNNVTTRSSTKIFCRRLLGLEQVIRAEAFHSKTRKNAMCQCQSISIILAREKLTILDFQSFIIFINHNTLDFRYYVFYRCMYVFPDHILEISYRKVNPTKSSYIRQCRCRIRKLYSQSHFSEKLYYSCILHHLHRTKASKQVTTFTELSGKHTHALNHLFILFGYCRSLKLSSNLTYQASLA